LACSVELSRAGVKKVKQEEDLAQVPLGPDVGRFYSNAIPVPTPACGFATAIIKGCGSYGVAFRP